MESHFQDWIDYNWVAFSIELLERGRTFSDFLGFLGDPTRVKHLPEAIHLLTKIKPAKRCLLYLNRDILRKVFKKNNINLTNAWQMAGDMGMLGIDRAIISKHKK